MYRPQRTTLSACPFASKGLQHLDLKEFRFLSSLSISFRSFCSVLMSLFFAREGPVAASNRKGSLESPQEEGHSMWASRGESGGLHPLAAFPAVPWKAGHLTLATVPCRGRKTPLLSHQELGARGVYLDRVWQCRALPAPYGRGGGAAGCRDICILLNRESKLDHRWESR